MNRSSFIEPIFSHHPWNSPDNAEVKKHDFKIGDKVREKKTGRKCIVTDYQSYSSFFLTVRNIDNGIEWITEVSEIEHDEEVSWGIERI